MPTRYELAETVRKLALDLAHVYSFVGDDTMPKAKALLDAAIDALRDAPGEAPAALLHRERAPRQGQGRCRPHRAACSRGAGRAAGESRMIVKTLQVRIKDKHAALLRQLAREVNMAWNFVNETSEKAIRDRHTWLSAYDLQKLTAGYSKCEGIHVASGTVDLVCQEYANKRHQAKRRRLNWRVSSRKSAKYSLGWVPFKGENIRYRGGQLVYKGHALSLWDSYGLADYSLRAGCFSEDARGRWYANIAVEVSPCKSAGTAALGIDLGLKTAVTTSDGQKFDGRLYRASEAKLAKAQRAKKKRQAKMIHAKIKNQRKDGLHKFSTALVQQNGAIFVGDVSSAKLLKTKMAKSVNDAGWAMFKTMLEQKCHRAGVVFGVVNESYTTRTCNACGVIAGPEGRAGLNKRMWRCSCGVEHDRDVNAALNIRARGLASLAEGASA